MKKYILEVELENEDFCKGCPAKDYSFSSGRLTDEAEYDTCSALDGKILLVGAKRPKECPLVNL